MLYLLGVQSPLWLAAGTVVFAVMELNCAMSGAFGEVLSARIAAASFAGSRQIFRLLRLGGTLSGGGGAILAVTVSLGAETVVGVFSGSQSAPEAHRLLVDLLRWTAPFFLFDAWQIVFVHALRGLRRTVQPMALSTGCYWLIGIAGAWSCPVRWSCALRASGWAFAQA